MDKSQIQVIRIDISSQNQSALSMLLHRDGTINRQGNGDLPAEKMAALGTSDGSVFKTLVELISDGDALLDKSLEYRHPEPKGQLITYDIKFVGPQPQFRQYVLYFGTDNDEVHQLVKFFDHFVYQAKTLTDDFYHKATSDQDQKKTKKSWWKF